MAIKTQVRLFLWALAVLAICSVGLAARETLRYQSASTFNASQVSEEDAYSLFQKGQSYFGGSAGYDLAAARAAYEEALAVDPRVDGLAWYQLGRIDFLEGKFNDAVQKFTKQYAYFGDRVVPVHYLLGLAYGYRARAQGFSSDWILAESEFKKFLALEPDSPWARTDLAWIYFSQGKYADIKPVVEEGLATHPDHPWLLNMYGLALMNTGEKERAHKYFLRAEEEAQALTTAQWGAAYPGNDPNSWQQGLDEMRAAIAHNRALSEL